MDTRTNDYFCDFKFNSFTFNAGQTVNMDRQVLFYENLFRLLLSIFNNLLSNIKITNHGDGKGKKNLVHAQLQNFIRLSGGFLHSISADLNSM